MLETLDACLRITCETSKRRAAQLCLHDRMGATPTLVSVAALHYTGQLGESTAPLMLPFQK
jgi:hypothetical protein